MAQKKKSTVKKPRAVKAKQQLEQVDAAELAKTAAEEAAKETLLRVGIDPTNPIQAQDTFATVRSVVAMFNDPEFKADLQYVKEWRQTMHGIKAKSFLPVVAIMFAGALVALWIGIKVQFGSGWMGLPH